MRLLVFKVWLHFRHVPQILANEAGVDLKWRTYAEQVHGWWDFRGFNRVT